MSYNGRMHCDKENTDRFRKGEVAGALGEIRTPDPRNRNPMLYPAELRARTARTKPRPEFREEWEPDVSDAFRLAERMTKQKPYLPDQSRSRCYQVMLKRPKWGCCATSIIGLPGAAGDHLDLATFRFG